MNRLAILLLATAACVGGADWLTDRGDAERSGWQRREKQLNPETVKGMRLLWKKTLDNRAVGLDSLSTPVMLGPIFTHRGIKELVFVAGTADNIFAVDADLGRIYWTRIFEPYVVGDSEAGARCGAGVMAAPVISPPPGGEQSTEDETEPRTPLRPIFAVSSDGYLHQIRPSTGQDMTPPRKFLAPGMRVTTLDFIGETVYATASCGNGAVEHWSIAVDDVKRAGPQRESVPPSSSMSNAQKLLASTGERYAGFAAAQDKNGQRWIYAARVGKHPAIAGFQVRGSGDGVRLNLVWTSRAIAGALPPVTGNGIVYVLASGEATEATPGRAMLYALDGETGRELYSSGSAITSFVHSSGLALANGHICFTTFDSTLYCFGLPLEI